MYLLVRKSELYNSEIRQYFWKAKAKKLPTERTILQTGGLIQSYPFSLMSEMK